MKLTGFLQFVVVAAIAACQHVVNGFVARRVPVRTHRSGLVSEGVRRWDGQRLSGEGVVQRVVAGTRTASATWLYNSFKDEETESAVYGLDSSKSPLIEGANNIVVYSSGEDSPDKTVEVRVTKIQRASYSKSDGSWGLRNQRPAPSSEGEEARSTVDAECASISRSEIGGDPPPESTTAPAWGGYRHQVAPMRVLDCTMSQDILAICYDPFLSGCDPLMRGKKAAVASSGAAAPAASDAGRSRAAVSRGRNNDQCTVKKRRCFFPFILSRSEPSADSCVDKDKEESRRTDAAPTDNDNDEAFPSVGAPTAAAQKMRKQQRVRQKLFKLLTKGREDLQASMVGKTEELGDPGTVCRRERSCES